MNKGYFDESNSGEWIVPIPDRKGRYLRLFGKRRIHKVRDKDNPNTFLSFKVRRVVWSEGERQARLEEQEASTPEKVNFIAEIVWENGKVSYWLCYYIFNRNGRWAFGQYGPMMPAADLKELYEYAHEKGVL